MVRKKSVSSKVKTRRKAYRRRQEDRSYAMRSWRILILTIKAAKKFLSFKHSNGVTMCISKRFGTLESDLIHSSHLNFYFRSQLKRKSKIHILNKYHNNSNFRNQYKARSKKQVSKKYKSDPMIRMKTIERAMNWYHKNNTLMRQNSRRLYNQRR
ncbi:unnamed protein product, partial [Rotaria sp. Silwood1]